MLSKRHCEKETFEIIYYFKTQGKDYGSNTLSGSGSTISLYLKGNFRGEKLRPMLQNLLRQHNIQLLLMNMDW